MSFIIITFLIGLSVVFLLYIELSEELRLQFQRHENTIDSIDRKVGSLMAISGVITTILIGLFANIFDISIGYGAFFANNVFVIFSMFFMILVVVLCVVIYCTTSIRYPFLGMNLSCGDNTIKNLLKWTSQSKEMYYQLILEEYVECLKMGEYVITTKMKLFHISIGSFIVGLTLIPITELISILVFFRSI